MSDSIPNIPQEPQEPSNERDKQPLESQIYNAALAIREQLVGLTGGEATEGMKAQRNDETVHVDEVSGAEFYLRKGSEDGPKTVTFANLDARLDEYAVKEGKLLLPTSYPQFSDETLPTATQNIRFSNRLDFHGDYPLLVFDLGVGRIVTKYAEVGIHDKFMANDDGTITVHRQRLGGSGADSTHALTDFPEDTLASLADLLGRVSAALEDPEVWKEPPRRPLIFS